MPQSLGLVGMAAGAGIAGFIGGKFSDDLTELLEKHTGFDLQETLSNVFAQKEEVVTSLTNSAAPA